MLRYVPPALENTIKERNGRASHRGVGSGRSTSRGGQNHPRKPIRPYPARPRSRSHPPRRINPSHQYERARTVSFPPSDVAAVPRISRVTRQPNSAGGAQSDDPAQESEPAGTRHAPDPREHAVARPGAPGLSASAGLTLSHGMHVRRRWSSGCVILVLFGNWLCLAVASEVKSAVGAVGCRS